jgi:hypothetical protein
MSLFEVWGKDVWVEVFAIGYFYLVSGKTVLITLQRTGGAAGGKQNSCQYNVDI